MAKGIVLYDGISRLDGRNIVCIATLNSKNAKTGDMVQTWVLRRGVDPVLAVKTQQDHSICGACPQRGDLDRGRSCYVQIHQAPLSIWRAYRRGLYPSVATTGWDVFNDRPVRFGAYGDPAAVPLTVWANLAARASGYTGYTHQWRQFSELKPYCMASVDSAAEQLLAKAAGWRTFRTLATPTTPRLIGEAACPAANGAGLTCAECMACDGTASGRRGDIATPVHGSAAKVIAFRSIELS